MSTVELLQPLLDQGIRNTNFFNGRLLSAEDLRAEQNANRQHDEQLGRAIGDGIVYGLEVTLPRSGEATIKVASGLAINRRGQTLALPVEVEVGLVRGPQMLGDGAGLFAVCPGASGSAIPSSGTGVYVLVMTPASGFEGRAPASGLGESQILSGKCGSRFAVEGVQFRLVEMNINNLQKTSTARRNEINQLLAATDSASLIKLRNLLAHVCFGTESWLTFGSNLFNALLAKTPADSFGSLAGLRDSRLLTDCDVPLALLLWTNSSLSFIDLWSVRRQADASLSESGWTVPLLSAQKTLREAMLFQFQETVIALRDTLTAAQRLTAKLDDYFVYLPAAGLLPVSQQGFNAKAFFGTRLRGREVVLRDGSWRALLDASLSYDPIEAASNQPVYLFSVAENLQASTAQQYLLFVKKELTDQFQVPLLIRRGASAMDGPALGDLFLQTLEKYEGLKKNILLGNGTFSLPLTAPDHLGISAIQQVIAIARSGEAGARGSAFTQAEAIAAFQGLAEAQQQFTKTYKESVLTDSTQVRYNQNFHKMIEAVDELLKRASVSNGVTGLFKALNDADLFEAATTQRAINQYLTLQVGDTAKGNVDVSFKEVSPKTFREGDIANFRFQIQTRTNIAEVYDLVPVLKAERQQSQWDKKVRFLTRELEVLPEAELELGAEVDETLFLQVNGVPAGTDQSKLQLQLVVQSKSNPSQLIGASSEAVFTVGQEAEIPADDIRPVFAGLQGSGTMDSSGRIMVTSGTSGVTITIDTTFDTRGTYTVASAIPDAAAAAEWQLKQLLPINPSEYNLQTEPIPTLKKIRVGIKPNNSSSRNTTLEVRVADKTNSKHATTLNLPIGAD